jgi:hypothetical protein
MKLNNINLTEEQKSKINKFISDLQEKCSKHDIDSLMPNTPGVEYLYGNTLTNGYFDSDNRLLACATGKELNQWLPILIHESSHMDQFLENDPVFNDSLGLDETFKWTEGSEDVDFNKIDREIESGIAVEVDCEKRTVEKIKEYGLEFVVSIDEYIQKSNAYVLFYRWMRKNRSWYKIGFEPYNVKSVYSKMPKTFEIDYTTMTQEVSESFNDLLVMSDGVK